MFKFLSPNIQWVKQWMLYMVVLAIMGALQAEVALADGPDGPPPNQIEFEQEVNRNLDRWEQDQRYRDQKIDEVMHEVSQFNVKAVFEQGWNLLLQPFSNIMDTQVYTIFQVYQSYEQFGNVPENSKGLAALLHLNAQMINRFGWGLDSDWRFNRTWSNVSQPPGSSPVEYFDIEEYRLPIEPIPASEILKYLPPLDPRIYNPAPAYETGFDSVGFANRLEQQLANPFSLIAPFSTQFYEQYKPTIPEFSQPVIPTPLSNQLWDNPDYLNFNRPSVPTPLPNPSWSDFGRQNLGHTTP